MKPEFLKKENRPVQYFSEEYLAECQKMSLLEIINKISDQQDIKYQTQIKNLMISRVLK